MAADTTQLKRGTRVVLNTDLPGVPEGTGGKAGDAIGLALIRYRVSWDNGVEMLSVAHTKLVPEKEWDDYVAERDKAAEAAVAKAPATAATPSAADDGEGATAAAPADDRLAALLARSKAAKEKKLAG